ncbi:hypothetical protein [Luteirhabdus pelagi]|uniref:hypothetical protein n=1 Tax=Luteirhabdus pelagi TaxID=2792783 RepID=UPI0019393E6D|nr:hypothetical protein [Luteirhabdus pelagi]
MGLINKISRIAKAVVNEIDKPESFVKGDEFENYVREIVFPKDKYELIHKTHSYQENKGDYIESTLYPDFLFRCKKTKKEFYVEAKFRKGFFKDKVEWTNNKQLKRYKEVNNNKPVIVCIGLEGTPKHPDFIFLMPVSKIKYTGLYESALREFEFYIDKPVFPSYLWKMIN